MKKIILAIVGVSFLVLCINMCNSITTSNGTYLDSDTAVIDTALYGNTPIEVEKKTWSLQTKQDEMDDSKSYWYSLQSDNYANFDFPYEGDSYLTITVRWMKKYGYDVLLEITDGQMVGNEYNGTNYVRVRFDGGKVQKFYYNEPNDGSSNLVFLRNAQKFIEKCKNAKDIIIEQEFYQEGVHQFKFHVDEPLPKKLK
nr:hypothetical protein [Prevotella sp.]